MKLLYYQSWEESEADWGVRPDGHSLHLTKGDAIKFCNDYMDRQREFFVDSGITGVPDEYSRPAGDAYLVKVDDAIYAMIKKSAYGVRFAKTENYEPATEVVGGKSSGWRNMT